MSRSFVFHFFFPLLLAHEATARDILFDAFESDGFGEWAVQGDSFGLAPVATSPKGMNGAVTSYANDYYVSSAHGGDRPTGTLVSPEFEIERPYITFLVSGGEHAGRTAVQLVVEDEVVRESVGRNDLKMRPALWPVQDLMGKKARIRALDAESGRWGIINFDHIVFSERPSIQFPKSTTGGTPHSIGLVPTSVIPGLQIPEGTEVQIFANTADHGIVSPTALSVDAEGRVYASETHRFRYGVEDNRDHRYWILDDLASQTTADRRAMHEKWAHRKPIEELTSKTEKIRVMVDTDGDGVADQSQIFSDGFNDLLDGTAAGIMALEGKVYFACIPNIWMLEDKDGDLVADMRKVLQDGFGVRVSFSGHDLNGFAQGPDGRIYCTIGDRGFSFTTEEGRTYKFPGQGAILRFEPDGTDFQVVHAGLRNPKEIAFDDYGTAITVDNNSDQGDRARVVFMMEGADSGWRMGHQVLHSFHRSAKLSRRPINMWMQEQMWKPENPEQPAFIVPPIANLSSGPSGLAFFPGTGYSLKARNQFLICDYRGGAAASGIWHFGLKPEGAGFVIDGSGKFQWGTAVTDLEWGYDGKLYISDFIGGWRAHSKGRIYSFAEEKAADDPHIASTQRLIKEDFSQKESRELGDLLRHPDRRIRLRAQLALASRPEAVALFAASANQRVDEIERLHGIWGLGVMARRHGNLIASDFLIRLLTDTNPRVRGEAVKTLGDTTLNDSLPLLELLLDPSERVRALACIAFSKHPHPEVFDQLIPLIEENNDRDPYLRHAASVALLANADENQLVNLRLHHSTAVRLAAVIALRRLQSPKLAHFVVDLDSRVSDEAIRAVHDQRIELAQPAVAALLDSYTRTTGTPGRPLNRMMTRRLLYSAFRGGGAENVGRLIRYAANPLNHAEERMEALRLLGRWPQPPQVDHSTGDFAPLPEREVTALKAAIMEDVHLLFQTESEYLGQTLALVSQYGLSIDTLDPGTLARLIRDQKADGSTRAEALKLFLRSTPEDPSTILAEAAQDRDDTLANTALKLAATRDPLSTLAAVKGALDSKSQTRRQTAWSIIKDLPAEHAIPLIRSGMEDLKRDRFDPASMLELLEAARSRTEPAIKSLLDDYDKSISEDDPLAAWAPALAGGDVANGKSLYKSHGAAQCMRCHRAAGGHSEGGEAGPNLAGVALRHDARGLLESLIAPSARLAPGYALAEVSLKNGRKKSGTLLQQDEQTLDLREGKTTWRIRQQDLAAPITAISSMPSMNGILSVSEARDIVAWLLTLTKDSGEKAAPYKTISYELSSEEPITPTEPPKSVMSETNAIDPAVMEAGKKAYMLCTGCHQPEGQGIPGTFPPLANSEWVNGPAENLIRIQLRGLAGPITVNGQDYPGTLAMEPQAFQTNEQIAAVLTYVRNSWGNSASAVTPDMVAKFRGEVGQPKLTVADLIDPKTVEAEKQEAGGGTEEVADSGPLPVIPSLGFSNTLGASTWGILTVLLIGGLSLIGMLRMKIGSKE